MLLTLCFNAAKNFSCSMPSGGLDNSSFNLSTLSGLYSTPSTFLYFCAKSRLAKLEFFNCINSVSLFLNSSIFVLMDFVNASTVPRLKPNFFASNPIPCTAGSFNGCMSYPQNLKSSIIISPRLVSILSLKSANLASKASLACFT